MMSKICKMATLSRSYNNQSIRATSFTLLDTKCASRHIITVSGHKSKASIKKYSSKTSENTLEEMSNFQHEITTTDNAENITVIDADV